MSRITPAHVVFFATSYAMVGVLTGLALREGANVNTVVLARGGGSALLLWLALKVIGASTWLTPGDRYRALALGVLLFASNYTVTSAIARIPVPVAILILYTFPILTAFASAALGRERLSGRMAVALALAFAGLTIVLQTGVADYDPIGLVMAALGSITFTGVLVVQSFLLTGGDPRARTLHMLLAATAIMLVVTAATTGFQWPHGALGATSLAGVSVAYVIGVTGVFVAAMAIGPARTSFFMNFEPLASVGLSALVLDQRLAPVQLVGALLVVAALFLGRRPPPSR